MDKNQIIIIVLAFLNIPVYLFLGKVLFGCWDNFWEAVRFWIQPDSISLFKGEYGEDFFAELKLGFFILLCIGSVAGEFYLIHRFFL